MPSSEIPSKSIEMAPIIRSSPFFLLNECACNVNDCSRPRLAKKKVISHRSCLCRKRFIMLYDILKGKFQICRYDQNVQSFSMVRSGGVRQ